VRVVRIGAYPKGRVGGQPAASAVVLAGLVHSEVADELLDAVEEVRYGLAPPVAYEETGGLWSGGGGEAGHEGLLFRDSERKDYVFVYVVE